jgi:hypothetical protein
MKIKPLQPLRVALHCGAGRVVVDERSSREIEAAIAPILKEIRA